MDTINSINNVPIRLSKERWFHITSNHNDLAGYYEDVLDVVEDPDTIIQGYKNSLIALKSFGKRGFLSVIYKELNNNDGFVITAYFTKNLKINSEKILWQKK